MLEFLSAFTEWWQTLHLLVSCLMWKSQWMCMCNARNYPLGQYARCNKVWFTRNFDFMEMCMCDASGVFHTAASWGTQTKPLFFQFFTTYINTSNWQVTASKLHRWGLLETPTSMEAELMIQRTVVKKFRDWGQRPWNIFDLLVTSAGKT